MRKLIYGINVTMDGCCDHTKGIPDKEIHDYYKRSLETADVLLYGRKTYELMVPFWPDVVKKPAGMSQDMIDFAQAFVNVPKIIVVSKTLEKPTENKTSIIRGNLQDEIYNLKQQPGKNIMTGGVDVPKQLIKFGLIDEIQLIVHPVIAGKGRRLFDDLELGEQLDFKLVETNRFKSGCVELRYEKT